MGVEKSLYPYCSESVIPKELPSRLIKVTKRVVNVPWNVNVQIGLRVTMVT